MNIQEIQADSKVKISKFDFSCDDMDMSIPEPLPRKSFYWIISGKPGSGKTSLILNCLCKRGKMLNRKFDRIYLWSPSLSTMKSNPFEELGKDQVFSELTEDNLLGVLDAIDSCGEKILFLIDDCVNDLRKSTELQRIMSKIIMNRRHLCGADGSVSIIMTSQIYNKIPAPIRKCADFVSIYSTKNKRELMNLYDEMIPIPKDEFFNILNFTFKKKHDFLFIDTNKDSNNMFHRNFNKLILNKNKTDKSIKF